MRTPYIVNFRKDNVYHARRDSFDSRFDEKMEIVWMVATRSSDIKLTVRETGSLEPNGDPSEGLAPRLIDGERIGESDGELAPFPGEVPSLGRRVHVDARDV